ncbi:MAG: 3-phosphoshikimate 1-carboxyvinyltransferase [Porticoccaceae bacterium]|nr:MAG: 3-phosphoshikimate 1-carboxyvinyltransferase [Porticoccaceae bacterium]
MVGRLLIHGLGLIGGSLAAAARQRGLAREVIGVSRRPATLEQALALGVVHRVVEDPPSAFAELGAGDLVVVCVPTLAVEAVFRDLARHLDPAVTITDVASVKGSVVAAARAAWGEVPPQLVPGHPIAGSEKSGVAAADAALFVDHRVILTPTASTAPGHLALVRSLWQGVGAEVSEMAPEEHDEVLAATSHLPHLLAYALVDTLAGMRQNREIFRYAAGGFRDFTRIAASDPVMWHDICLANREAILAVLDRLLERFGRLREALIAADGETLLRVFTRAREARHHYGRLLERKRGEANSVDADPNRFRSAPVDHPLEGRVRVPGDKSISHRAVMLGSLAEGVTEVSGFLEGEDALATLAAFRSLGVPIEGPEEGRLRIHGVGLHGLEAPGHPLYLGNSGTSMRLLAGLLAGQRFDSELTGDESLSRRPMRRVAEPLARMGAKVETSPAGTPPLRIYGGRRLVGIDYAMPVASAQVKSALLLAGLYARGQTRVTEPAPTRDHTERMLAGFGWPVRREGATVVLDEGGSLRATAVDVPADISSAAFFLVAATLVPGSDLLLEHVGVNPTRTGVIDILRAMGADIELVRPRTCGGEPVADLRVRHARLRGIAIPEAWVPLAIDEFPVLFVAAACAEGTTVLAGAGELRVKESDRIQVMAEGLASLGIDARPTADGIVIKGGRLRGGRVASHGDHRIAMAFAVAGLVADGPVEVEETRNVATSFPGFVALANAVGFDLVEEV